MRNLTRAYEQLFHRTADETFPSLEVLSEHCRWQKQQSLETWQSPSAISANRVDGGRLTLNAGEDQVFAMNAWSFSQLCRLAGVAKETVNRLTVDTASSVFRETLPRGNKPLQLFAQGQQLRSIHAASYTRLYNADVLAVVEEFSTEFQPAPRGVGDASGLYAGEQDMFVFLIDPTGWTEIDGEAFAPGFFVFNSEVGSRCVGIETFWFQQICRNHIVWDAVEVVEFSRKHTANVRESLDEIRRLIEALIIKRDQRRDGFAKVISQAMRTTLGDDAEEVQKVLAANGITRSLAKSAIEIAEAGGGLTIFALVDALTRVGNTIQYAADRTAADQKAARLLALAV